MNKKGQYGGILGIVVFVIVSVIALSIVYSLIQDKVTGFTQEQTLINYSSAPGGNLAISKNADFDSLVSTTFIRNSTNQADFTTTCNLTTISNVPYIRCSTNHTTTTEGLIDVSYYYTKTGYYTGGTTRTIGNLLPILFAVGILAFIGFAVIKKK